ncbi:hypothetical protein BZZ01_26940 [Nostocales cyanobacterium HT-58-2]|nr:hypothetical protein BZZ01_26940 [Nostocales cyanobacterium HT-58-2]
MEPKTVHNDTAAVPLIHSDRIARAFVWSVWLVMMLVALACVTRYGQNIPLAEDWLLVAPVTGNEPDLLSWLWAQNNEHRVPLPRLMLLALLKVTGGDFRVGMVFNAVTLGVVAIAMMQVARKLRGRTDFADAFFPVALLHLGNWENLVWSWQLSFVFPTALICGVLLAIVSQPTLATPSAALFTGIALILLPLCGGIGLLFVPFLALWLSYCGFLHLKAVNSSPQVRSLGGFLIGATAIALCLVGLYFVGYQRPYWNPPSPGLGATLKTAAMFLALGFGPVAAKFWKLSILVAFVVLVPSLGVAVKGVLRHQSLEKHRALGVLLFFSSLIVFALAMGWGRSGLVPTVGMPIRYVLLAVPIFCTVFLVWELYASRQFRTILQRGLLIGMCLLIPVNTMAGFQWRNWYLQGMNAVEQDLLAGTPRTLLAKRHKDFLIHWWDENKLASHMQMLHDAGIGLFTQMREK